MKNLILSLLFILPTNLFASGKLSLKGLKENDSDQTKYSLGLSIYEKVARKVAYVAWIGAGEKRQEPKDQWTKTEQGLEFYMGPLSVGAGFDYKYLPQTKYEQTGYYGTLGLSIW